MKIHGFFAAAFAKASAIQKPESAIERVQKKERHKKDQIIISDQKAENWITLRSQREAWLLNIELRLHACIGVILLMRSDSELIDDATSHLENTVSQIVRISVVPSYFVTFRLTFFAVL